MGYTRAPLIVTCDGCQRRYTVPDEKLVPGKPLRLRCKNCQQVISVAAPEPAASPWDDEVTRAAPALDRTARWHAVIREQQAGPFDVLALDERIRHGEITLKTMVWREGMDDWARAQEVPELIPLFAGVRATAAAPPPPPEPPKPPVAQPVLAAAPKADLHALFGDLDLEQTRVKQEKPKKPVPAKAPGGATAPTLFVDGEPDEPPRRPRLPFFLAALALVLLGVGGYVLLAGKLQPAAPLPAQRPAPAPASEPITGAPDPALRKAILGKSGAKHEKPAPRPPVQTMAGVGSASPEALATHGDEAAGGPSEEELQKVIAALKPAFASCVDQELKRNPDFKGQKVKLTATVSGSGKVSAARIAPAGVLGGPLSACLEQRARAMAFAPFAGDPVDLEIPVNLTTAM